MRGRCLLRCCQRQSAAASQRRNRRDLIPEPEVDGTVDPIAMPTTPAVASLNDWAGSKGDFKKSLEFIIDDDRALGGGVPAGRIPSRKITCSLLRFSNCSGVASQLHASGVHGGHLASS